MSDDEVSEPAPSRAQVAARWRALAAGAATREEIHAWAAAWVEDEGGLDDVTPLIFGALQHLHGFDLCRDPRRPGTVWHGSAGEGESAWVHSREDIADGFARWQERCASDGSGPQAGPEADPRAVSAGPEPE